MDHYDNTPLRTEEQEDEPFYCSPACAEEDIIWPGSDREEAAEDTQRKHARFEHHAKRYLRGHLPVLQSAILRGPLSGWVNPWRWVPKQDDWWQPGSEAMLFTREKVMKRAADHGLGYLGPTEALAWCKASAQAEAQHINGDGSGSVDGETQPEIGNAMIGIDAKESPKHLLTKDEPLTLSSEPRNLYEDQSMVNHHSETPYTGERPRKATRSTKRAANSQWLKGSFVSKRARWDDPAITTPTPHSEMGEKHRRRHQSFPKQGASNNRVPNESSHLSVSFAYIPSAQRQLDISFDPDTPVIASPNRGQTSVTSALNSAYKRSSLEQRSGFFQQQDEEIDELHDLLQGPAIINSPRNTSLRNSQRPSSGCADASSLDVEPDDLNAITPCQRSSPDFLGSGGVTENATLSSKSNKLPRLLRKTPRPQSGGNVHAVDEGDEYSFITEVAPSSRDLEMFQYKKRRKRIDSEELKPNPTATDLEADFQESTWITVEPRQTDEDKNTSDVESSSEPRIGNETKILPHVGHEPIAEDEAEHKIDQSDKSWDFMNDTMEQPSPQLAGRKAQAKASHRDHNSPSPIPQMLRSLSKTSSQHLRHSLKSGQSRQSQPLPDPQKYSPGPSAAIGRVTNFQSLNDTRTQSYNTSPPRPTLESPFQTSPRANQANIQHEARFSREIRDVMEEIQNSHSQHCPKVTSLVGTQSENYRGSEISHQNEVEVKPIHLSPLDRRHTLGSSGANIFSQTPVEGEERTMGSTVDKLTEIATVSKLQRSQNTLHSQHNSQQTPVRAKNAEKEPEPEARAESTPPTRTPGTKDSPFEDIKNQRPQTKTESSHEAVELPGDELSITGALGEICARIDTEFKAFNIDSETSWEGCGPQSPWAAENLEILPVNAHPRISHGGLLKSGTSPIEFLDERLVSPDSDPHSEEPDWHPVERPQTPSKDIITPFKNLMSPTPVPDALNSHLKGTGLPNTQSLVDAATNNPWSSNLRNPSSKKSKKRVSFGILQPDEKENSQPDIFDEFDQPKGNPGSPPPPQYDSDEDIYADGTATVPKFIGHFVAARQLKLILPQTRGSPLNSSPRLSAQAEAFIAADSEASVEQRPSPFSPKSASRPSKLRSDRIERDFWQEDRSLGTLQTSPELPDKGVGNFMASFDMDDALGDMSDFLEDWSVDAELKKVKGSREPESSSRHDSNGQKRRRLFGLV